MVAGVLMPFAVFIHQKPKRHALEVIDLKKTFGGLAVTQTYRSRSGRASAA